MLNPPENFAFFLNYINIKASDIMINHSNAVVLRSTQPLRSLGGIERVVGRQGRLAWLSNS